MEPSPVDRRRARHRRDGPAFSRRLSHRRDVSREAARNRAPAGTVERLSDGPRLRLRLDAVHRADPGGDPGGRRVAGDGRARRGLAGRLFARARRAFRSRRARDGSVSAPRAALPQPVRAAGESGRRAAGADRRRLPDRRRAGGLDLADRRLPGARRNSAERQERARRLRRAFVSSIQRVRRFEPRPASRSHLLIGDLAVVALLPDVPDIVDGRAVALLVVGDVADHGLERHCPVHA